MDPVIEPVVLDLPALGLASGPLEALGWAFYLEYPTSVGRARPLPALVAVYVPAGPMRRPAGPTWVAADGLGLGAEVSEAYLADYCEPVAEETVRALALDPALLRLLETVAGGGEREGEEAA